MLLLVHGGQRYVIIELLTRIDLTTMHGSMPFSAWVGCHYAKIVGEKLPEYNSCDEDTSQGDLLSHRIFRPSIK